MRFVSFDFAKIALLFAAVAAGLACSEAREPTTPRQANAPASLHVTAIAADGGAFLGGYAVRQHGATVDSVRLDDSGRATLTTATGDTLMMTIAPSASTQYYASIGTIVIGGDTSIDVVLIPTSWTVQRGRFAGAKRPIEIIRAFGSDAQDTHFLDYFAPARGILVGWAEDDLPIQVGYDTTGSTRRWTAPDSMWFWSALTDINDAMGRTMFTPATTVGLTASGVVGVRVDYSAPGTREGSLAVDLDRCRLPLRVCSAGHGNITLGYPVFYRPAFEEENFRAMQHEMMHALGFGHACYWPSVVMHTGTDCAQTVPRNITVDDVAYIEMLLRVTAILKAHPYGWNLEEALTGARLRGAG